VLLVTIPGTNERIEFGAGASLARAIAAGCPAGGINDAYRSYAEQVTMFLSRYRIQWTGRGIYGDVRWWKGKRYVRTSGLGMAAIPGTSTHGIGLAIDFAYQQRTWLRVHGAAYGWVNTIRSEPWHWEYQANKDTHKGDDDMTARDVWSYKNPENERDAWSRLRGIESRVADIFNAVKGISTPAAPTIDVKALAAEIAKLTPAPTVNYAALAKAVNDDTHARMKS